MTDICERRGVRWLERDSADYLAAFIDEHRGGDGTVRIALRLPLKIFAAWTFLVEQHGMASCYSLGSSSDQHATYSVTWSADGRDGLPEFEGALAIEPLIGAGRFGLVLSGHYQPPLGRLGSLFDAVLGRRIAKGSAQDLLHSIVAHMESASMRIGRAQKTTGARREEAHQIPPGSASPCS
jgi:hypothetical protein